MAHKISFTYVETKDQNEYDEVKRVEIHTETSDGVELVEYFAEFCRSIGLAPEQVLAAMEDQDTTKPH